MARIELIYDGDCPNVDHARAALLEGFAAAGLPPSWSEWERSSPDTPTYARGFGSPTILIDGNDVADAAPGDGESSCRLYRDGDGSFRGAPTVEQIAAALRGDDGSSPPASPPARGWTASLAALPGIAIAFLPNLACPACWPAYAGLLGSVGMGFLLETAYLVPLTVVFLFVYLGGLAFRARQRRGYGPFVLGMGATMVVLSGKFIFHADLVTYGGIGLLIAASVWNAWPGQSTNTRSCPDCVEPVAHKGIPSTP